MYRTASRIAEVNIKRRAWGALDTSEITIVPSDERITELVLKLAVNIFLSLLEGNVHVAIKACEYACSAIAFVRSNELDRVACRCE